MTRGQQLALGRYHQRLELLKLKMDYTHTKQEKEGPVSLSTIKAINNSIKNRWPLFIFYVGDKEQVAGNRYIECYTYGLSKFTGNQLVRAYQYGGESTSIVDGFKTFRLDRIRRTAPLTSKHFDTPRPLYAGPGDLLMSTIYKEVIFPKS